MTNPAVRILLILLSLPALAASIAHAQIDDARFREDLKAIAGEPRAVGSIGYYHAADYIETELRSLANVQVRRHEFPVMAPVTRCAQLLLGAAEKPQNIYPFWPAQVRVNATPDSGITGTPIYLGEAHYNEIKPADVNGQIAVIEASAGTRWTNAAYFGAKAILVLGKPDTNNADLRAHDLLVPVNLPRFYIPPGQLADALRAGRITTPVTLKAAVDWERKTAVNFYALIRARSLAPTPAELKTPPPALMISVPYDASSLVPDLAYGASQAVQAAAGLALVRDLARHPLDRPVIVFFGGADSIAMLATRNMFMALSDLPSTGTEQLDLLAEKERAVATDQQTLQQLRDRPHELHVMRNRPQIDRIVMLIESDIALEQDELFQLRRVAPGQRTAEQLQREQDLAQRQTLLNQLRYCFMQRPNTLTGPLAEPAKHYVRAALAQLEGAGAARGLIAQCAARHQELQQRIDLYGWLANELGIHRSPDDRSNQHRLIELLIALDLTDRGVRCGPMFWGRLQQVSSISQIQDYRDWFTRQERLAAQNDPAARWWGDIRGVMDFEPLSGACAPQSWLCASMPIGSELAQSWGVPGLSIITLDGARLRRDTPTDTLDNINPDAILPQLHATRTLLANAWNDPKFRSESDLKWQRTSVSGQVVSSAAGRPVPDLPRQGFLATYYNVANVLSKVPQPRSQWWTMGVRRAEVRDCDAEGNYIFEALSRIDPNPLLAIAVEVFQARRGSGEIIGSTDLGRQSADLKFYGDIRQDLEPFRSVVFACEEFSLADIYDPRFLQSLGEVIMLDARRNAEPQRYNALLFNQLFAGFVEPGATTNLLFRYGRVGNRLILINMPASSTGGSGSVPTAAVRTDTNPIGYTIDQLRSLGPLAVATAKDFWQLDDQRLRQYRKAGVSSTLVDQLHSLSSQQLTAAADAYRTNDGEHLMNQATGAWANSARVYSASQSMANDVIRAAIFLLLLCVPFSFAMERLLIASPSIYRQIAGGFAIFTVMAIALWSFHPAFKISASPLIIILAFAIIFMSIVVIFVVYGKFDTELKRIRSGRGPAGGVTETTSFARASVLTSAILLGIANMRRRKFRTALTSITIVLITFAVLCFTSATRYLDTTTLPTGVASSYPGLMLRQRGYRPMPGEVLDNLRPLLGARPMVERWWAVSAWDPRDQVHLIATAAAGHAARVFGCQAILGLSPGESQLSPQIAQVIGAEKFARLENGEQHIVYLSKPIAEQLAVREGDSVRAGGIDLQVAAVFDPQAFDQKVMTLSGDPIAPLKYMTGELDAGGRALTDVAVESFDLDASGTGAELSNVYEHLPSSQFVIMPARTAQLLPNCTLRSVAARLADGPPSGRSDPIVKQHGDELAKRFAVAMFAGFSDGVRMVSASNLASVSGAGQVAIPLAIAGLIIFNTMMGSIAERKREIHIYTSLGLAPFHVGALFLAEALTYGLIGTVFGYVIGQGVGTAMLKLGWLGNITLNYSGTSAMMTMGLILLIVLLSAFVPARLASQLAAPSIERTWKVPLPTGPAHDEIIAVLPFTINKTAADGALAYLVDYFDAHREGSIGKFSAGRIDTFAFADEQGRPSRGLKTVIWLTPFDLGVRQHFMLLIHPGEFADIYEVQVILQRQSGDDGSWYRMNRTFLTELRKQFLLWRSLAPARMMEYVQASKNLSHTDPAPTPQ